MAVLVEGAYDACHPSRKLPDVDRCPVDRITVAGSMPATQLPCAEEGRPNASAARLPDGGVVANITAAFGPIAQIALQAVGRLKSAVRQPNKGQPRPPA